MNKYEDQARAILSQWRDMKNDLDCDELDREGFLVAVVTDFDLAVIEELLNLAISSTPPTQVWGTSKRNTDTSGIRDFDHEGEGYTA